MAGRKRIKHDPIVLTFADRLRTARRKLGMSQQALARAAQVTTNYIGLLERGEVSPGLDMVGRLARTLGIDPTEMIAEPGRKSTSLEVAKEQLRRHIEDFLAHDDLAAVQAMALLVDLARNALSHRRK